MLVTNHVLSGALVGYAAPGAPAAFLAGVASHFALDTVPHWGDDRPMTALLHVAVPDGLLGLTVMAAVTGSVPQARRVGVLAGMAGAAFPDLDKPSVLFFGSSPFPRWWDDFHQRIQTESPRRLPQELLVGLTAALVVARVTRRAREARPVL
jgi:hypothetical protein